MSDLVEFLLARLAEDKAAALAASPGPWHVNAESDEVLAMDGITVADGFALSGQQLRATTAHIARHDPARVLAEVEAKRQLVDKAADADRYSRTTWANAGSVGSASAYRSMLRILALPYADRPGFREEWRP